MKSNTFVLLLLIVASAFGQEGPPDKRSGRKTPDSFRKATGEPRYGILNINNLTTWHRSDGHSNRSPQADNGVYYPRRTGNVIYQDCIVWGGKMYTGGFPGAGGTPASNQVVRVGGGSYGVGTRAGRVIGSGATATPEDPNLPGVRMYRIRRDYYSLKDEYGYPTEELWQDAADVNESWSIWDVSNAAVEAVYNQYDSDWKNWPVSRGAPFIDRNRNGVYDPPPDFGPDFTVDSLITGGYDEPGVAGIEPNSPADQVLWTVYNDLDAAQSLGFARSEPIGLEIQKTVWGYKRSDVLGNIYFQRHKLINKGGPHVGASGVFYIDSMFVCQWSDPDLGSWTDDLIGCDSVLSLGFIYNGNPTDATFQQFNLPPPSAGYDFLAGPIVSSPGDTAVFDLKYRGGYRNLGMSSFAYFSSGSYFSDPPNGAPASYASLTGQWWKMLRGFTPIGLINDPDVPYERPPGFPFTRFPLSGDPLAGDVFIDGRGELWALAPGDRRILCNTGPFQMAPGDTQEIVVGFVAGMGADRLSSVGVMKFNDRAVQDSYDNLFDVVRPPQRPRVTASAFDRKILLQWGDIASVQATEAPVIARHYSFEGYNIYQLPEADSDLSEGLLIATFDRKNGVTTIVQDGADPETGLVIPTVVQRGTDSGIRHYIEIEGVYEEGDQYTWETDRLNNGQLYHYAVTAYNYSPSPSSYPRSVESDPAILSVRPQIPFGKDLVVAHGDTLPVTQIGLSDGQVVPVVIDPLHMKNHSYEVSFDTSGGVTTWELRNTTAGTTVLSEQPVLSGDSEGPMIDGFSLRVYEAPLLGKDWSYISASPANLSPVAVAERGYTGGRWYTGGNHGGELFFGGVFLEPNFWGATTLKIGEYRTVEVRFSPMQSYTDLNGDGVYSSGEPYSVAGQPHIQGAFMYQSFDGNLYRGFFPIPFTAWDVTNPGVPVQLNVVVRDLDDNGQWDLHREVFDPALPNNGDQRFNYVWITNTPYDPSGTYYGNGTGGTVNFFAGGSSGAVAGGMWVLWLDDRNSGGMLAEEGRMTLVPPRPQSVSDFFLFDGIAPLEGAEPLKASIQRIGVYPNPYLAGHAQERSGFDRYVMFNNLPQKAKIRIFNLAGQLVRVLEKDDQSQFLRWDLMNQYGWQVSSGMYVCYIELPALGETKVLKLAVIQAQVLPE